MSDSANTTARIGQQPGANFAPGPELLRRILHMQQMMTVGQSFLDSSIIGPAGSSEFAKNLVGRLQAGNISPQAQAMEQARLQEKENQLAKAEGREPREIPLPTGTNYFTEEQAREFVADYTVTQKANDATGFSATLITQVPPKEADLDFKREIVVAIRDTEFRPNALGGGATQDVIGADFNELVGRGAALGQIAQADKWFREQVISKLEPGEKVSIASGSLSGHIGQVLELLYPEYINASPNSNISFNPTNAANLKDPTGEKTSGQLWREVIETYTSYRDDPSLAKSWLPQYGAYENGDESRTRALIETEWLPFSSLPFSEQKRNLHCCLVKIFVTETYKDLTNPLQLPDITILVWRDSDLGKSRVSWGRFHNNRREHDGIRAGWGAMESGVMLCALLSEYSDILRGGRGDLPLGGFLHLW